ncbi:MAG: hypothetical protein LBU96_07240 [Yokenella regensburgei]|jgi:hypothetical protein|nr:hypothetical protein [Yokenella regensburgei]
MQWQYLQDDHGFRDEHYRRFCLLTRDELLEILPEIAGCHISASVMLKNKWLTAPCDILPNAVAEYECRTETPLDFRKDAEAERWLHELRCAVLESLVNVPVAQRDDVESFILRLFAEECRVAECVGIGEGWSWRCGLEDTLSRVVLKNAQGRPEALRERLLDIISHPGTGITRESIRFWMQQAADESQKAVLEIFVGQGKK